MRVPSDCKLGNSLAKQPCRLPSIPVIGLAASLLASGVSHGATVIGKIFDAQSNQPIPARVYIQADNKRWHCPESSSTNGSAVLYDDQSPFNTNSVESHGTVSAHPFKVELPAGGYSFTIERGKDIAR